MHTKKFLLLIALSVIMIAVGFSDISPAFANGIDPDPTGCEAVGGDWVVDGDSATCTFPPDSFWSTNCKEGYGAVDYWSYSGFWTFVRRNCRLMSSGAFNPSETGVTHGVPVDAWNGNCGAYISNPPLNGKIIISKYWQPIAPNMRPVCEVQYFDWAGNQLQHFGSPGWLYYNLNNVTAKQWGAGELNFYLFQDGDWQVCANPIFVDVGDWGRLACFSGNPYRFGIGTSLKNVSTLPGKSPFIR